MAGYKTIPDIIEDNNNTKLSKGQYLGKGTFGRCYTLKCLTTGDLHAGKCLHKKTIEKFNVSDKIEQEVAIHKHLQHKNIVRFAGCIEDRNFIYIILELCTNKSMSELIKRRKYITAFEAKYYLKQIVCGIQYLHAHKIVHRDLKLGNLLINHNMEIKIGDFGLAAKLSKDRKKRHSLCGTPNYIAPEVLSRQGHSYEVDIWAVGCILYTLLVGNPPFQTESKEETFNLIINCKYEIPNIIKKCAANFILRTIQKDPNSRPLIHDLSRDDFLNIGFIPKRLPTSCIVMPPRTKALVNYSDRKRHPLRDINLSESSFNKQKMCENELNEMLMKIQCSLKEIIRNSNNANESDDEAEDPSLQPFIWVNSWMDYSHLYGFSFKYNDNTVGALFNDGTTLMLLPSGKNAYYIHDDKSPELSFSVSQVPTELEKKMTILKSFRKFMFDRLKNAYEDVEEEPLASLPILTNWINTKEVTAMYLSNATFQINFLKDHLKLIICPVMEALTVIFNGDQFKTFQISILKTYGCSKMLLTKLNKTVSAIDMLVKR